MWPCDGHGYGAQSEVAWHQGAGSVVRPAGAVPYVVPPMHSPAVRAAGVAPVPPQPGAVYPTSPSSSSTWKADPFDVLGDATWFPAPSLRRAVPAGAGLPGSEQFEVGDEADEMVFLRRAAALLGSDVPEAARQDPGKAAFAEATRLLMAVVGFICEGHCPPMLRGNVVTRGPYLPAWSGMVPHIMLRDWFDANDASSVVNFFGSAWLRKAFEAADRSRRGQFVALLSRAAYAEVLRPGVRALRAPWQKVFESFPELGIFRALLTHVRRRLWEDARDRSRSRSRERKPKPEPKNEKKQEGVRFIVKNAGNLPASELEEHFQSFGKVLSCNVLIDKRTKKSRGVAFVAMLPEGHYDGRPITEEGMKDWVLHETHICGHMKLEVTLAEVKQEKEEDEDRKREERVEERRRSRVEKEQRMSRTLGGVATLSERGEERLVPSHWHKRWRNQLFEFLPRGPSGPTPWGDPRVTAICAAMWTEVAEHAARTGDRTVQEALSLFQEPASETPRWSFIPAAELLLIIGEGIVGLSALGVFVWPQWQDPVPPRSTQDIIALAIPCFAQPFVAAAAAPPQPTPGMPKGSSDREKIFVGGLPHHCTLDMLTAHFGKYGRITDAVVMADKATGKPRGFGFVVFEHISCVEAAIRDYGKHAIDGKWVDVKRATPQDQAAPPPQVFAPAASVVPDVRSALQSRDASPEKPAMTPFNEVPPPRFDDAAGPGPLREESYDPFG